jgi:secreted PhoX family phosphatase
MAETKYLKIVDAPVRHGSRSMMTCKFRCNNACDHAEPNTSDNAYFGDVLARTISRRSILMGGAAGAATVVATMSGNSLSAAATSTMTAPSRRHDAILAFSPVAPNKLDELTVPPGFKYDVLARWGDPVVKGAPVFDAYNQTPEAQAKQFGYNCDYVGIIGMSARGQRAIMAVNNEYTDEILMFPEGVYDDASVKQIAIQAHGISVIDIERGKAKGSWRRTPLKRALHNRRITGTTPHLLAGPAAGDERLKTSADSRGRKVLGTLANCSGGVTPWGTTLHGEENFNGYFDASGALDPAYSASYARYGISGSGKGWNEVDSRFDLTLEPHEPFRFGYIVEVDVTDPRSTPRKHTMLGRMKHEGATCSISPSGRAVVYMGDDERGDYIYKFVSRRRFDPKPGRRARAHNLRLLEQGTLYVARFTGDGLGDDKYDGTGVWIPLTSDEESFVDGFSVADVLIDTRLAADTVSPTKMDRPEDIERNPTNGKVYAALTNNSNRGTTFPVDEANPLASSMTRPAPGEPLVSQSGNRNGYILELTEANNHQEAEKFRWDLFLVCGDPTAPETYFAGFPKDQVSPLSCPDNVAFDAEGNLWISTDGNVIGSNDGLLAVPVEGPNRGRVQQYLTVPLGAETCGPWISADSLTVFAAVQHPGEIDGFTFDSPASTWPHTDSFPRPSVVCTYRKH